LPLLYLLAELPEGFISFGHRADEIEWRRGWVLCRQMKSCPRAELT
jgi:hypothetical protein